LAVVQLVVCFTQNVSERLLGNRVLFDRGFHGVKFGIESRRWRIEATQRVRLIAGETPGATPPWDRHASGFALALADSCCTR
jgi:hypothetical protein